MSHKPRGVDRRRSTLDPLFPLTLPNGEVVAKDRRSGADRRRLGHLARQAFFHGIPFETLEGLAHYCDVRELTPGEILLRPGEDNHTLFLVLNGQLMVHIDRPDGPGGFAIEPGQCTGEISIIDGKPASAYVVAAEPTAVVVVPEDRFWTEFMKVPAIARNFMKLFAERFRARNHLMQRALEERLRYEHLERELGIAHEIQLGMLPQDVDLLPAVDLVASMEPARHIGGDFYDVFPVSDTESCIAIGDVAGKGVPAALFMVKTMTLLRGEMLKQRPLEQAMAKLNAALCRDNARCMFVTLIIGVLDRASGAFRYVSAGHNPLLLGGSEGGFRFMPRPNGILAGVDEGAAYESATLRLRAGEFVVLYTDGVTEAMNGARDLFGDARLLDALQQGEAASAAGLADSLRASVETFVDGAPQADDLTLVVLRYLGVDATG